MVILVATVSPGSTICGNVPSNNIIGFCITKVCPYFPTKVSEPSCSVLALIDSFIIYL